MEMMDSILTSLCVGIVSSLLIFIFYVPKLKKFISDVELKQVASECSVSIPTINSPVVRSQQASPKIVQDHIEDRFKDFKRFSQWILPSPTRIDSPRTLRLFTAIQIFTACFAAMAHGANDVSNAIAPLSALFSIYRDFDVNQRRPTSLLILIFGVFSICAGLWILGHKVIDTIGKNMSEINAASGFCIDFGSALTVLFASKYGLPVSTTHCLVGSVIAVGSLRGLNKVNWSLFRSVAASWVVTLPVSGIHIFSVSLTESCCYQVPRTASKNFIFSTILSNNHGNAEVNSLNMRKAL